MYDWLNDALRGTSRVVTANRRLARELADAYGRQQIRDGRSAWRSPGISAWSDWLNDQLATVAASISLPTRINSQQSRVLWERCLRREVSDPLLNMGLLVRQARESWTRLQDFNVPLGECESAARGKDQRIFAAAAASYQSILERENWIDESQTATFLAGLIAAGRVAVPESLTFAGFDRFVPQVESLLGALRGAGCDIRIAPKPPHAESPAVCSFENTDAEMRAVGGWAREQLRNDPDANIAIVVTHLERNADHYARLVREGFAPGWQMSGPHYKAAVNVSYGRQLSAYPAIAVALLALRWLHEDLGTRDISALLRSSAIGTTDAGGRSRFELQLRRIPDRLWTPEMVLDELHGHSATDDAVDWLSRVEVLKQLRNELPAREAPSEWAVIIDATLEKLNWPGGATLVSEEFQLLNRWKELLNDLARLELVTPSMTLVEALRRLQLMAGETVFQAESEGAIIQLLGPLEAAGMEFDQLWIAGLSAANWPPAGRPSLLISRDLQRRYAMPHANPEDTLTYAQRVLGRLLTSSETSVCSYPLADGDAEQDISGLLAQITSAQPGKAEDPGWYARNLVNANSTEAVAADDAPAVAEDEAVSGGAATIQNQLSEPFSAFAYGRLGIRTLPAISSGLAASFRGTLIHDALHALYKDLPSHAEIVDWSESEQQQRVAAAISKAFRRHERNADPTLQQVFALEKDRVARLLRAVVLLDREREPFQVCDTEGALDVVVSGVRLSLRIDRVDLRSDGSLVILDYKTGAQKRFLDRNGEPNDMQLVVYASAVKEPVAGLGLVNIDSRNVDIDAAGRDFTPEMDWDEELDRWKLQVAEAANDLQRGDVRVDGLQTTESARTLGLLSRISELRRDS
jgi:probable DNA repair protein